MKRKMTSVVLILTMMGLVLSGCGTKTQEAQKNEQPEIGQVRSICELATLECYYHNVAKSTKTKGEGITHIGEKDRKFWIEYTGTIKMGIDMSKVKMSVKGTEVKITMPEAEVLDVSVDEKSYNEDSYTMSQDGWNQNKITAEDATAAIKKAKKEMTETAMENSSLLLNAQERAKKLIKNYVDKIGEVSGVEYKITWEDAS